MSQYWSKYYITADTRTNSKHGHTLCIMNNNTNQYEYLFFPQTISQCNCLPKSIVDSETVDAFKHSLFDGPQLSTLVALTTSVFIPQEEFLLIIYSDSDSDRYAFKVEYHANENPLKHSEKNSICWSKVNVSINPQNNALPC